MTTISDNSNGQLRSIIERIERIEEEVKSLNGDKREIYAEAKSNGYDPRAIRELIKERTQDQSKRGEIEAIKDTYRNALGEFVSTPLGAAAVERAEAV